MKGTFKFWKGFTEGSLVMLGLVSTVFAWVIIKIWSESKSPSRPIRYASYYRKERGEEE